jgi:hypothetical protein
MRRAALLTCFFLAASIGFAQERVSEFRTDISGGFLIPVTWASEGPTLAHRGFDLLLGLEYDSRYSIPFRFEVGYINASPSYISSSGELYRGWEGTRFSLLTGYSFKSLEARGLGSLTFSLLAGGALTAAVYAQTALTYAYPSIILEPRLDLRMHKPQKGKASPPPSNGPWLALPLELMYRSGVHSLAPGLSLGWSYVLAAAK